MASNPFRYVFLIVMGLLEPFAFDLWRHEISRWLLEGNQPQKLEKQTYFGGLYQKIVITR